MIVRLLRSIALLAAAAGLAACASPLDKPPVEQRFYTLDVERPAPARSGGADVLAVRRFRASPGYEGRELVFATNPGAYRTDFYNVFFAAPAGMVASETREWLGRSGLFRSVVAGTSQADPRWILEGNLVSAHGEAEGGANRAVLETQFLLLDARAADVPVVLDRTYREAVLVADGSAGALAAGLNGALAAILRRFEADLAATLGRS
ncbi:MAG: membrane integrity-associated transporter subunit PqiC [Alphaproteobacteria bacterium]|nr:membrane integrity-associated transporter subunit PqiC [Alphaproteobacteria bacterium]